VAEQAPTMIGNCLKIKIEGGGAVLSSSVRLAHSNDLRMNPTMVVEEIGRRAKKRPPTRRRRKRKFKIGQVLLFLYFLTRFFSPPAATEDNECLIKALRNIGAKVPLGKSKGYWAQKDGNVMLESTGKRLEAVSCPNAEDVGRYIVHSTNHFMALRIHVDKVELFDGSEVVCLDDVDILQTQLRDPRFYKLCNDDWETHADLPTTCRICKETILGTPMIQNGCGPLHFGCLNLAYSYERYYPDDAFGCAGGAHECFQGCHEDQPKSILEDSIANNELDIVNITPRRCVFQNSSYYFVRIQTNADGACGLHALFGKPVNNELYLDKARQLAVKLMQERLNTNSASDAVVTALWSELAVPAARRQMKNEAQQFHSGCFWRHMTRTAKTTVIKQIVEADAAEVRLHQLKVKLMIQARKACRSENDTVIRELQSRMNAIYPLINHYADILNPCPTHDDERLRFFLPTTREARNVVEIISDTLEDVTDTTHKEDFTMIIDILLQIADANILCTEGQPEWFLQEAIPIYLKALETEGHEYYLSLDELLEIAKASNTNLVVTQYQGAELEVIGQHLEDGSPPIFLELTGNSERGHFTRLMESRTVSASRQQDHRGLNAAATTVEQATKSSTVPTKVTPDGIECEDILPIDSDVSESCTEGDTARREEEGEEDESDGSTDDDHEDLMFLPLERSKAMRSITEQDKWTEAAKKLALYLRDRPTLPPKRENSKVSFKEVDHPVRLPLFCCPFESCTFSTNERWEFLWHIGSTESDAVHIKRIRESCGDLLQYASPLDFVYLAISHLERQKFPLIGPAITRRALRYLTHVYNDNTTKAMTCFICAQIDVTLEGPECLKYRAGEAQRESDSIRSIHYCNREWFNEAERTCPGTLLNNCSHELWRLRYVQAQYDKHSSIKDRSVLKQVEPKPKSGPYALTEWCLELPLRSPAKKVSHKNPAPANVILFGCTEDVRCKLPATAHQHKGSGVNGTYHRRLCSQCEVPICRACRRDLYQYSERKGVSTIPLALANDNFYGYIRELLVKENVTWLECACSNLVWSTILVYYLEEPYGNLMQDSMEGAQARTQARGNLFSFSLPWEDIEQRCSEAQQNWSKTSQAVRNAWQLPHEETILSTLLNVHIVGGTTDLAAHLQGAKMRPAVVLKLIDILRDSGYPGYTADFNSKEQVQRRMMEMYTSKYGDEAFIPDKIKEAIAQAHRAKLTGDSLILEKNATPSEPPNAVSTTEKHLRPISIVAQRSGKSSGTSYEEHGNVLARFQTIEIQTGSTMLDQHLPQYLGFAHPFTMPVAVGGYDVRGKPRWRRPSATDLNAATGRGQLRLQTDLFRSQQQVEAAQVELVNFTRGMARRIEGQYRRHWGYIPGLWNLYFREQVNLGVSLAARTKTTTQSIEEVVEQDAAMAAAELYEILHKGYYLTQTHKRMKIDGDMTKLRFAEHITPKQQQLLADYSFRTRNISGTQEIRTKIGQICFWGSIVYGNGIFMTVSPGERHNYLAIKLSRYRRQDPFIAFATDEAEKDWIGIDKPSLEAKEEDSFSIEVPGYDIRRLILARDPLAAVLSFSVQLRKILATLLGVRMCSLCPDCACTDLPCSDAFGSNAEAMGGICGRSDGLCGAVECQKITGCLHFHFWLFVQRLHQYNSLEDIAKKLEAHLVTAEEFKNFCTQICCEEYAEPLSQKEETILERRWPCFHEGDESSNGSVVSWGSKRFGRIPPFIWKDEGDDYTSLKSELLNRDATVYKAKFQEALKESQKCAQHHIHKKDPLSSKRVIPKPCRCKNDATSCKHGFPMVDKLNRKRPLLICKGLAKRKRLNINGSRCMLGSTLGLRDNEWLNGTAPGLCIGLSGSNSDVKLNDRLPILDITHESKACKKKCVPTCPKRRRKRLRRETKQMQLTFSRINGYFGGYIAKKPRSAGFETKKCVDKMYALREKQKGRTQNQQARAVSGRMVTDVEMNGTARGAVEEVNLSANLSKHDVLCQECVRTFRTITLDGQRVLHRLELEEQNIKEVSGSVYIPSTRRPQCRSKASQAPVVDIYGYRNLDNTPFSHLSIYEFLRYWHAVPLLPPANTSVDERTAWTRAGLLLNRTGGVKNTHRAVKPGIHYKVIEPKKQDTYFTLPDIPELSTLRHCWVIERNKRPAVPIIQGLPLPSGTRGKEYNARYTAAFFRPWSLIQQPVDREDIRHLSLLGIVDKAQVTNNTSRETNQSHEDREVINHDKALRRYLQHHLVSDHAAQLLKSFLLNTMARNSEGDDVDDEADKSDVDNEVQPLRMSAEDLRTVLVKEIMPIEKDEKKPQTTKMNQHQGALNLVSDIWGYRDVQKGRCERNCLGPMCEDKAKEHIAAKKAHGKREDAIRPYSGRTIPKATLYTNTTSRNIDRWLEDLAHRPVNSPTAEQMAFLRTVADRLKIEAREELCGTKSCNASEPIFDLLHGVPGCGKSQIIQWIRDAFEKYLDWTHGVQFVCIAFQNTMAAHISGSTIHHWTGIPIGEGGTTTKNLHNFSVKCQSLRWVIIDEISMVSALLLGRLEKLMTKVARRRCIYRCRPDRSRRPFGGVNMLLCGDFFQLKPVRGLSLYDNWANASTEVEYDGMKLLWGIPKKEAVHRCWNLNESLRCSDPWYNEFLHRCRNGNLTCRFHQLIHGFPTSMPITAEEEYSNPKKCDIPICTCLNLDDTIVAANGEKYLRSWVHQFLEEGTDPEEFMNMECQRCKQLRKERRRVLQENETKDESLHTTPFDEAPALYAYNVPRFQALLYRARVFAREHNMALHWCYAQDIPLHCDDRDLPIDQLNEKRRRYLGNHDQQTSHIASLVPLVKGLPVKLTDAVDRGKHLFRGARGYIVGWAPHHAEERTDIEDEVLISHMPSIIYVKFPNATWTILDEFGPGIWNRALATPKSNIPLVLI